MSTDDIKFKRVEKLVAMFKPERYVYLFFCGISCAVVLVMAVLALKDKQWEFALAMAGSTGVLVVCIRGIMKLWNDVVKILFDINAKEDE